jgi:hypothetical protein
VTWNALLSNLPTWKVWGLIGESVFQSLEGVVNIDARVSCNRDCVKMCYNKHTNMGDYEAVTRVFLVTGSALRCTVINFTLHI